MLLAKPEPMRRPNRHSTQVYMCWPGLGSGCELEALHEARGAVWITPLLLERCTRRASQATCRLLVTLVSSFFLTVRVFQLVHFVSFLYSDFKMIRRSSPSFVQTLWDGIEQQQSECNRSEGDRCVVPLKKLMIYLKQKLNYPEGQLVCARL